MVKTIALHPQCPNSGLKNMLYINSHKSGYKNRFKTISIKKSHNNSQTLHQKSQQSQ